MRRLFPLSPVVLTALLIAACSDTAVTAPQSRDEDPTPATVLPDLTVGADAAGTSRYVPLLERILVSAIKTVKNEHGDAAAGRIAAQYRRLRQALRAARAAGDAALIRETTGQLETFAARIGLRVFGPRLARRVLRYGTSQFEALVVDLRAAATAGQDITRISNGARLANRYLNAAHTAAEKDNPLGVVIHASHAVDLIARLHAAL